MKCMSERGVRRLVKESTMLSDIIKNKVIYKTCYKKSPNNFANEKIKLNKMGEGGRGRWSHSALQERVEKFMLYVCIKHSFWITVSTIYLCVK